MFLCDFATRDVYIPMCRIINYKRVMRSEQRPILIVVYHMYVFVISVSYVMFQLIRFNSKILLNKE